MIQLYIGGGVLAGLGLLLWLLIRAERAAASADAKAKQETEHAARMDEKAKADAEKGALAEVIRQDAIVAGGDADGMRRNRLSEALRRERDS